LDQLIIASIGRRDFKWFSRLYIIPMRARVAIW
jgi:hypothetical protein